MKLSSSSLEKTAQKNPRHIKWRGFLIVDDYFFLAAFLRRFGAAFLAAGLAAALRFLGAAFFAAGLAAAFLRFFGAAFFAAAGLAAAFLRRFGAAFFAAAGLAAAFLRFFGAAAGLAAAFLRFFGAVFFAAATCYSYRNGSGYRNFCKLFSITNSAKCFITFLIIKEN